MRMCMWFGYNCYNIFCHFFHIVNFVIFHPLYINSWYQGSGNFEIWIGPADDDDVISEPIFKKKKNMYISPVTKTNDNWQSYNSF